MARTKQKYSIWKYYKTEKGWRYCRAAYHPNYKIKPNIVFVGDVEELHKEGNYYLYLNANWELIGPSAADAEHEHAKRVAADDYERLTGTKLPDTPVTDNRLKLKDAVDGILAELQDKVDMKNNRPLTYALA
jgi:hypothetical protein